MPSFQQAEAQSRVISRKRKGHDMARDVILSSVDLGTSKTTTLVARLDRNDTPELLGIGIAESAGVRRGAVVNIEDAESVVRKSLDEAARSSGVSPNGAFVNVTGDHLEFSVRWGSVRPPYYNAPITAGALHRSIQAVVPPDLPPEKQLLHVEPQGYAVDGLKGIRNPIGMHALRLDLEALCVVGATGPIKNLDKVLRSNKIGIRGLVMAPLAAGESVLSRDEREMGVVLVEIGGGTTAVSVYQGGHLVNASVLPVGGYQFTTDLAVALNSPFDVAEELKLRFGYVIPEEIGDETVAVEAFGDRRTVKVDRREICRYLHERAEEVLRLVALKVHDFGFPGMLPAGVVLTGGGANLGGIEKLARRTFNKPVRRGSPNGLVGLPEGLQDPSYAATIGSLLWGVHKCGSSALARAGNQPPIGVPMSKGSEGTSLFGWLRGRVLGPVAR
jgi:cell division protein FtsA